MQSGKASALSRQQSAVGGFARSIGRAALAIAGLLAAFAVSFFAVALSAHSRILFPASIAFAYTVGIAVFVLSPGRGTKGYNPFGPVVRRALGRLVRLHAVCLVVLLLGLSLVPWVRAHASPWWTAQSGSRHSTWLGTAEAWAFLLLVIVEGILVVSALGDAELELLPARANRTKPAMGGQAG